MITPGKRTARSELQRIEDALIESIINSTDEELRDEIVAAGDDLTKFIADVDATIASARIVSAKKRLEKAKAEVATFKSHDQNISTAERNAARVYLDQIRSTDQELASKMMMAARKGEGFSDRDLEGLFDDIARLRRLEREKGKE